MKWNRGADEPRLGLLYRTEPSSCDEKRHAFEKFYKGWRDYMEGRPICAPPVWPEADRKWYEWGCEKAQAERPAKELVRKG
jgi:hypothetical protein